MSWWQSAAGLSSAVWLLSAAWECCALGGAEYLITGILLPQSLLSWFFLCSCFRGSFSSKTDNFVPLGFAVVGNLSHFSLACVCLVEVADSCECGVATSCL